MSKRKIILAICAMFLLICTSNVKAVQILEQKVIASQVTDCDMQNAKLIFNNNNNLMISMDKLLYANESVIKIGVLFLKGEDPMAKIKTVDYDYCCNFLGGFAKDNQFYVAFDDVNTINFYSVQKRIEPVSRIKPGMAHPIYERIITLSE